MNVDAIVAGAGIWGCTLARRIAESGRKVLVLEKRSVVGGNVRCEVDPETGIEIHTYGSHIFHTHIPEVWKFINRFVEFNGYQHKVLAYTHALPPNADARLRSKVEEVGGRTYHLPLGLTLINKFFDVELRPGEVAGFLDDQRRRAIFDAFFRGYTCKQWGKSPEEIDPSVIKRVPVRSNYDTNYFNDYWQGIPAEGYNMLFERLLDHPNISVECNVDFNLALAEERVQKGAKIFYSGPVDRLFDYKFGALPWRSLKFELERLPIADYQGTSVINYAEMEVPYTRIHEFRHYHPESNGGIHPTAGQLSNLSRQTIIMREFSKTWELGDEPYYPINNPESAALLARYQEELDRFNRRFEAITPGGRSLVVGGRLGDYKYYDMDKSIEASLKVDIG